MSIDRHVEQVPDAELRRLPGHIPPRSCRRSFEERIVSLLPSRKREGICSRGEVILLTFASRQRSIAVVLVECPPSLRRAP